MPYFKLTIAYDGTRFHGFQRQTSTADLTNKKRPAKRPHWDSGGQKVGTVHTIQECLERVLCEWSQTDVQTLNLLFAGRTDRGVHARGQVAVVLLPTSDESWQIRRALNTRLPVDISIERVENCHETFHPRHQVKNKLYSYTIKYRRRVLDGQGCLLPICSSGPHTIRTAMESPCLWICPWALDDTKFLKICESLQGTHDYRVFVHKDERDVRSHVLTVSRMSFEELNVTDENAPVVIGRFLLEAERFRRTMVRNLVGYMVDVCRGEHPDDMDLWSGDDKVANTIAAAPASGLCLERVEYAG